MNSRAESDGRSVGIDPRECEHEQKSTVHCSDILQCPASQYLICPAYLEGKMCFQVTNKPCCKRNDIRRCRNCWVYIEYHLRNQPPQINDEQ